MSLKLINLGVITHIEIPTPYLTAKDSSYTRKIEEDSGAAHGYAKAVKRLYPQRVVRELATPRNEWIDWWKRMSAPSGDDGWRIINAADAMTFMDGCRDREQKFMTVVSRVSERLDELKEEARQTLGHMYRESDYPTKDGFIEKFRPKYSIREIPSGNFLVEIASESIRQALEVAKIEREKQLRTEIQRSIITDLADLLHQRIEHLIEVCRKPDARFRSSVINNIIAERNRATRIIELLEPEHAKKLSEIVLEIDKHLTVHNASTLKDHDKIREDVVQRASEVLNRVKSIL